MTRRPMKCGLLALQAALCLLAPLAVQAQPIKVDWLPSLTGPLSSAAIAENQGVQLAVEEINKSGALDELMNAMAATPDLLDQTLRHAHYGYLVETGRNAAEAPTPELWQGNLLHRVLLGRHAQPTAEATS